MSERAEGHAADPVLVQPGTDVVGSDGDKLGTVIQADLAYVVVERGLIFPTSFFIPTSAIVSADDDRVTLAVTKDDALRQGWDREPSEQEAAGTVDPEGPPDDAPRTGAGSHPRRAGEPAPAGMAAALGTVPPAADFGTLGVAAMDVDRDYTEAGRPDAPDEVARDAAGEPSRP